MVTGDDFRFGYRGIGDTTFLAELSKKYNFTLEEIKRIRDNDRVISSSYVREEVASGNIEKVNRLLGYHYFIIGKISHGNGIGKRVLERPTINIVPPNGKLIPRFGVYATTVEVLDKSYIGVSNLGIRPTISEEKKEVRLETHILDFDGDVYGEWARVNFIKFLRDEKKFSSIEALMQQIELDVQSTLGLFKMKV